MESSNTNIKWQEINDDDLDGFAFYTTEYVNGLDQWEKAALKKAYVLDLPGMGIDVRCSLVEDILPIVMDDSLKPYNIVECLYPDWIIETDNRDWLRLRKDNDMVEFEILGDDIGYVSMYWEGVSCKSIETYYDC